MSIKVVGRDMFSDTNINFVSKPSHPCMRACSWTTFPSGLALPAPATARWTFLCNWDRRPQPSNSFSLSRPSDLIACSLPWLTLHQGPLVSIISIAVTISVWNSGEFCFHVCCGNHEYSITSVRSKNSTKFGYAYTESSNIWKGAMCTCAM